MKATKFLAYIIMLWPATLIAGAPATASDIARRWCGAEPFMADATFNVTMPQMNDEVNYTLSLESFPAPADTLLPVSYLIDWRLNGHEKGSHGFAAYYSGNHYRFNGTGLVQEYHANDNPAPFLRQVGSRATDGVQYTARFADLLPIIMGRRLSAYEADSTYTIRVVPDTIVDGRHRSALLLTRVIDGTVCQEGEYLLDKDTLMPISVTFENNPGTIGEQSISIHYTCGDGKATPVTEDKLFERYGDIFANYRESNYGIETLAGKQLPEFSLPTLTGERFTHHKSDPFRAPAIIVVFEAFDGMTPKTIAATREACAALPYSPAILFVATDNNADAIEQLLGQLRPDETHLMSARGFARDCGISNTPVVIITDPSARVVRSIVGYTPDLVNEIQQTLTEIEQ